MKVDDVVIFTNIESTYAKWFYGQIGLVENYSTKPDGSASCRVRWLQPVKYFKTHSTVSDFSASNFEVHK